MKFTLLPSALTKWTSAGIVTPPAMVVSVTVTLAVVAVLVQLEKV